jgi:energy-converting hydrogenase Eha subunit A
MSGNKKLARLAYPTVVIAVGLYFIVAKRASYGIFGPEVEGPVVVLAGILSCLLGAWGFVGTLREFRKKEEGSSTPPPFTDIE